MGFFGKDKKRTRMEMEQDLKNVMAEIQRYDMVPMDANTQTSSLFPEISGMSEIDRRVLDMKGIANRIRSEQKILSTESDGIIESLKQYEEKMHALKQQLKNGAKEFEEMWIIINFEHERLKEIIEYSETNKKRREGLPAEIAQNKGGSTKQNPPP